MTDKPKWIDLWGIDPEYDEDKDANERFMAVLREEHRRAAPAIRTQDDRATHSFPEYAEEENCRCGQPAAHKVEETSSPGHIHPLTAYLCCEHFRQLVGDCSRYPYDGNPH